MTHAPFNYVRTFRKRHALSEDELGFLMGRAQSGLADFENGVSTPKLRHAFALQVLFRQVPHQMFPGLFEEVEERVVRRAATLLRQLEGKADKRSNAKRELLENMARLEDSSAGV